MMKWIFLPGLHCRADIFEGVSQHLPHLHPIFLDWPWPEQLCDTPQAAQWLAEQVSLHQPQGITGHSMGGVAALYLYGYRRHTPALPVIIVDTFLQDPHPFFRNHLWEPTPELEHRIQEMLCAERERFPQLRQAAMRFGPPADWRERVCTTHAQFIYGGRSGEHSDAKIGELAGLPPDDPRVQVIPGTSHFLMLEQPALFYTAHTRAMERLLRAA